MNIKRYPIIKKSLKVFFDLARVFLPTFKGRGIFLNSIPKSGTHLLHQILINFAYREKFGFFASTPSWDMKIRPSSHVEKYLSKIYTNEIISGHLFYSNQIENFLRELSLPTIFIYRDPRAIFLSELHYLSEMNRWYKCHNFF